MTKNPGEINQSIKVLELRNYLLKQNMANAFSEYFNAHFVNPMTELGGYTFGQFKINGICDRFIWMRGFTDMEARLKFLNDFYIDSHVWKEFGPGANDMMINSDNVYLLRPLINGKNSKGPGEGINSNLLKFNDGIIAADFYICNCTLDKVIDLFTSSCIPFFRSLDIDTTLWVSEMSVNDFPRLPVFQDKNLLLTITRYKDEIDYRAKQKMVSLTNDDPVSIGLKNSMQQLVTIQSDLILYPITQPNKQIIN
jgi:hypothetical protein